MESYSSASKNSQEQNLLTDQSLTSSISAPCLKTSSHIHSFNLPERFCGDPLCSKQLVLDDSYFGASFLFKSLVRAFHSSALQFLGQTSNLAESNLQNKDIIDTSDACYIAYNIDFRKLLQTVNQAANEILIIGREQGQAHTAQEMSNGLFEMKDKDEQATLEYCIKLYTKASFLYRACHHDLGNYYSIDDRKLYNYTTLLNCYIDRYGKSYIGTVYRGALLNDEKLKLYLTNDIDSQWYSPTYLSTSKSRKIAEIYGNVLFIINIQKSDKSREKAVDISKLSAIPDEEEILLTPKYLLSKMKQSEFDPVLKKHIIYLMSANPSIIPAIQNNRYDYRGTKRKLKCNHFSSRSKNHFKETDSSNEDESNHYSSIVPDEQSTNND